ncbi:MAG TPA: BatA domain-containing protein, partial [Longimicrobium sp.]|nr:BatA domain-containing protein [Longimicrobium sp.]
MLTLAAPAFLLAGALAMLVPLALHLIRRRPPMRAPLPTVRFLAEDPRNAVRVSRPTDLPLLVLRMLLLLLLGFALARPAWLPAPEGTSTVVLLERGAAMRGEGWRAAVAEARRSLLATGGQARGELVLFDTAAVRVPRSRVTPALF